MTKADAIAAVNKWAAAYHNQQVSGKGRRAGNTHSRELAAVLALLADDKPAAKADFRLMTFDFCRNKLFIRRCNGHVSCVTEAGIPMALSTRQPPARGTTGVCHARRQRRRRCRPARSRFHESNGCGCHLTQTGLTTGKNR